MSVATEKLDPGPLADVKWYRDGFRATLVFVREIAHTPGEVWPMLTDPDKLRLWSPFVPSRALDEVGPVSLSMTDGSALTTQDGEVLQVIENSVLDFRWDSDLIRVELIETGNGCMFSLSHTMESPDMVARVAAGWHLCLVNAGAILDGEPARDMVGEKAMDFGWQDLHDSYDAQLHAEGEDSPLNAVMRP